MRLRSTRSRGDGEWFAAKITKVNSDGTYNLTYDDGDTEDKVPANRLRAEKEDDDDDDDDDEEEGLPHAGNFY